MLKFFLLLLLSVVSGFAAVGPGLTKTIYVNSGQYLTNPGITNVATGSKVVFGPGSFAITNFFFKHGVTYEGQGMGVTIIYGASNVDPVCLPGSATVRNLSIYATNQSDFNYPLGRSADPQPLFTNALFEGVELLGSSDCVYALFDQTNYVSSIEFRNCKFRSSWDSIVWQGSPTAQASFINCDFDLDITRWPNTTANAISRQLRFIVLGAPYYGANLLFRNCAVELKNSLNPQLISEGDIPGIACPPIFLKMQNVSFLTGATNSASGVNVPYVSLMEWTNFYATFDNVGAPATRVTAAINTNGIGPEIVHMVASGARTNWLPRISANGQTNVVGLEITVKDAAGTAGTGNISVRPLGGATVNGAAVYTINANYAGAKFRTLGTNWITITP